MKALRKSILVLGLLMSFMSVSEALFAGVPWKTDFEKARQEAKIENKLILLKFSGSDWCIPCIKMEKNVFAQDTFSNFASDKLVMVNADFPRKSSSLPKATVKQNEALAEKYDKDGRFPYTILMNADGKVLMTWDGYSGVKATDIIQDIKTHTLDK